MDEPLPWSGLIVLLILLAVIVFINVSETALLSVNKIRIKRLAEEKEKRAKSVLSLIENPAQFLSVLIIGINFVTVISAALVTTLTSAFLGRRWVPLAILVWTVIIIIFGEITPKAFTAQRAEFLALRLAKLNKFFIFLLSPVVNLLTWIADFIMRPFKSLVKREASLVTGEEIRMLVNVGEEEGAIEEEEKEMINGVFGLGDTQVKEVMVPHIDMACLEEDANLEEVLNLILEEGHSRIPVYEETIDKIIGVVYAKDLLAYMKENRKELNLKEIVRPAYFVPETKKVNELLREFQKEKVHIAIVVDEYGGTAGLVTIEDLLEEIVGEIQDEYDQEEPLFKIIDENSALVDARLSIDKVNELLGINLPAEEVDSVGGFVYTHLGKVPEEKEEIDLKDFKLVVEKVEGQRVSKIRISKKIDEKKKTSTAGNVKIKDKNAK